MFKVISGTLLANRNTIEFTDETINNNSIFEVYADQPDVIPVSVTVGGTTASITFDAKASVNTGIKILVNNIEGEFAPDSIDAENVNYTTESLPSVENVKDGLDGIINSFDFLSGWVTDGFVDLYTQIGDIEELETESTNLVDAINEVFTNVDNGKTLIADAITDKGVETSASDTFETMANNIAEIESGGSDIDISLNANWYTNLSDCVDNGFQKFRLSSETVNLVEYDTNTRELVILDDCIAMFSYENDHSSNNVAEMNIYINGVLTDTFNIPLNSYIFRLYNFSAGDKIKVYKGSGGWSCIASSFIKKS